MHVRKKRSLHSMHLWWKTQDFSKIESGPNYTTAAHASVKATLRLGLRVWVTFVTRNYEGVKILSTGGTHGDIFTANAHGSYFMSFAYLYLHHALDKNSHVEALYDYSYGKSKAEKSPWIKKTKKKTAQRRTSKIKKCLPTRCFSWEIVIYCQGHSKRSCFSIGLRFY